MENSDTADEHRELVVRLMSQVGFNETLNQPLSMASDQLARLSRQWLLYSGLVMAAFASLSIVLLSPAGDGLRLSGIDRALVSVIWAGSFYLLGFCVWQDIRLRHLRAEVALMGSFNCAAIEQAHKLQARLEL